MLDETTHTRLETPPGAICPVCGLPPSHDVTRRSGKLVSSDLICNLGHVWAMRWVAQ